MKKNSFFCVCALLFSSLLLQAQPYELISSSGKVFYLFNGIYEVVYPEETLLSDKDIIKADAPFSVQSTKKPDKIFDCPAASKGTRLCDLFSKGYVPAEIPTPRGPKRGELLLLDGTPNNDFVENRSTHFHYLLIGVHEFEDNHWIRLPFAGGYINHLSKAIRERTIPDNNFISGFQRQSFNIRETERDQILASLEILLDSIKPDENNMVLIYLASHGVKDPNGVFHFVASDTRYDSTTASIRNSIDAETINSFVNKISSKGAKVLVFVDACYSGTLAMNNNKMDGSCVYFMSTEDDLYSWSDTLVGSCFVNALIRCLSGEEQDYFRNIDNNNVSPRTLQDYLYRNVQYANNQQRPISRRFGFDMNQKLWRIKSSKTVQFDSLLVLAMHGNTDAIIILGDIYMDKKKSVEYKVGQDTDRALNYYHYAYVEHDPLAACRLGMYHYYSTLDYDKAFELFKESADKGCDLGRYYLGVCYDKGLGIKKSKNNAKKTISKLTKINDDIKNAFEKEQVFYSVSLKDGVHVLKYDNGNVIEIIQNTITDPSHDPNNMLFMIMTAQADADKGDAKAQAWLGNMYHHLGRNNNNGDYEKAYKWYKASADQGNKDGLFGLGLLYMYGNGVEKNYEIAIDYFQKAADDNHARAYAAWGEICYNGGYGIEKDQRTAVELWKKAADLKDEYGQYQYGFCLFVGDQLKKDDTSALKYFKNSAEKGFPRAQFMVGYCLFNGIGVKQNKTQALKWLKKAKENGDVDAKSLIEEGYYADGTVRE